MAADGIDLKMESPSPWDTPRITIMEQMLSYYWKKL